MGATFNKESKTFRLAPVDFQHDTDDKQNGVSVDQSNQFGAENELPVENIPEGDRLSTELDTEPDSDIQILIYDFQKYASPRISSALVGGGLQGGEEH